MYMANNNCRLLFITQKIHEKDDDLAFVILWLNEFVRQGVDVQVICLEKGEYSGDIPVYSLGKEQGKGKLARTFRFLFLVIRLRYTRVFIHMNPEYTTVGGWYWLLRRIPTYLWYTHYTMHIHMWLSGKLCKRLFAATPQSLPQYTGNPKKIILGHGIDIDFWQSLDIIQKDNTCDEHHLVSIHRICRSKRLDLAIETLQYLPEAYDLTIYGRDVEKDYYQELQQLVRGLGLEHRVHFMGPVPMAELLSIYPRFRLMINMASETIDKTMLEGMLFGVYPITTRGNSEAIGLPVSPLVDDPKTLAAFIQKEDWKPYSRKQLVDIVSEKHSLPRLIEKMNEYIKPGK